MWRHESTLLYILKVKNIKITIKTLFSVKFEFNPFTVKRNGIGLSALAAGKYDLQFRSDVRLIGYTDC